MANNNANDKKAKDNAKKESVAVIMSVYKNDKAAYLKEATDSLLCQSYNDYHVFIGVDGPVGRELDECLNEYCHCKNVSVTRFPENRGLACVLNDLLNICFEKGYKYIARMDADDISLPDRFQKQMNYLLQHKDIDVVGGSIEEIDENDRSKGKIIVYPEHPEDCYKFFAYRDPHAHPAVLFRKRYFEKAGCLYRPDYRKNQDTMLWFDGMKGGTLHANLPDVVLKFRLTDSLLKSRRSGWKFAKKQWLSRILINKTLNYGFKAYLVGYMIFLMQLSPSWVKRFAYKMFR